ncbi:MAG: DUF2206 domain-containing protein, partial [Halobacteriota archaeon]
PSSDPYVQAGLGLSALDSSASHTLGHYWQIITEVLIVIGLGFVIWNRRAQKMSTVLLAFSLASFAVLLVVLAVPVIGSAVNSYRAYSVALLFLAPCCIFGVEAIVDSASKWLRADKDTTFKLGSAVLIGVLAPYFLFQSGFIFELAEHPSNYDLLSWQDQSQRVLKYSDKETWSYMVGEPIPNESVYASKWLSGSKGPFPVYVDGLRRPDVIGYGLISPDSIRVLTAWDINHHIKRAYIYLGAADVQRNSNNVLISPQDASVQRQNSTIPALSSANRIYSSGLAEVYYST